MSAAYLSLRSCTGIVEESGGEPELVHAHAIGWAGRSLDSVQTEEYDESLHAPVGTLSHTDRENRAMASVFSSYLASFHDSSNRGDRLTLWPHADHCFYPSSLDYSRLQFDGRTDPLAHSYDCEATYAQRTTSLHGAAANDADVSTRKPRRLP
jgi:hypothetical protein